MHSSMIKLVVEKVSRILDYGDPFISEHTTASECNDLLQFLVEEAEKSPTFAVAIWHYLLDAGYQIGNCSKHVAFEKKFHKTLVEITPPKRVMLRRISEKLFVKQSLTQA